MTYMDVGNAGNAEEDDPTWVDGQAVDSDFDGIPDSIDDTPNTADPNICPDDHSVLPCQFAGAIEEPAVI